MTQLADTPLPSTASAVIVAVPPPTTFSLPSLSTATTLRLEVNHPILGLLAVFALDTLAFN